MPAHKVPTKVKVIRHTFRKDRQPGHEPDPEVLIEVPEPPPGLPADGEALWRRRAPELVRIGLLTVIDLEAFETACLHWGIAGDLLNVVLGPINAKTGKRLRTVEQYMKPPARKKGAGRDATFTKIALIDRIRAEKAAATKMLAHFGMTPEHRSKLDLAPEEKEKPSVIARMMNET